MVGLPIDGSENGSSVSLASKAAESQLCSRINSLRSQLRAAESSLENLQKSPNGENDEAPSGRSDQTTSLLAGLQANNNDENLAMDNPMPVSKRGYLFKWLDRSIGWSGSKWALRFVFLDGKAGELSYFGSHEDVRPRYVLSLRGTAVRDDGWKRNERHKRRTEEAEPPLEEPGAYFFIFSLYQRPVDGSDVNDADVVPLLRFSSPSMAEQLQWIKLISEACAYCETDQWIAEEAARSAEVDKQQRQQLLMTVAMPEAKDGTLPPLFFAPHKQSTSRLFKRRPSFTKTPSAANFRSKSKLGDVDKRDAKSTRGYPPSKPMHRVAEPSYLSVDAPVQNYRGFFNLGVLILLVSNIRLLVGSVQSHGFVFSRLVDHIKALHHIRRDPWEEFPFVSGALLQLVFTVVTFCIEWLLSSGRLPGSLGMFLHYANAHMALAVSLMIVWTSIDGPAVGAVLLLHATITWMKLLSYAMANEDYRIASREKRDTDMLALVKDLDPEDTDVYYPDNVTLRNMFYFWLCPSLTYQIAFPKLPRRRYWKIGGILLRMVFCTALFTFLVAQIVSPVLSGLVQDLEESGGTYTATMLADYWLRLAVANSYLWLLMFYFYFHLYLNLFAEILRFGDRVFYKDWWNSSEVSAYWRLWNMPVHYWLIRHVYFPCVRKGLSRNVATFLVFLLSAIMHEVLISIPFHMVRPWSFIGMMMQIPLVAATKFLYRRYPGTSVGNLIFWLSFCVVGQPMAVFLYTVDYQYAINHSRLTGATLLAGAANECRVMWDDTCVVR